MDMKHEHTVGAAAAKAAPPVGVSAATLAGVPVSDMVLWITLIYLVVQVSYLAWRWYRDIKMAHRTDDEHEAKQRKRGRKNDGD